MTDLEVARRQIQLVLHDDELLRRLDPVPPHEGADRLAGIVHERDRERQDDALLTRFVDWLREQLSDGVAAASASPPLTTLAAMLLLVLLVIALGWLLSQARLGARSAADRAGVLADEGLTATELRARAEAALADGRPAAALVDAFRALARRQIERGRIDDRPGATAHELSDVLGAAFPPLRDRLVAAGRSFDVVLYGGRPATVEQVRALLDLDDELVGVG